MKQQRKFCFNIVATSLIALSGSLTLITQCNASDFELSGKINAEYRQFVDKGAQGQDKQQVSIAFQPQLYWKLTESGASVTFEPFYRHDSMDDDRTHADIRELEYMTYWGDYEYRMGFGKVFWGVTESAHLVDVINQIDSVESVDGEDKLGQPMVHFSVIKEWGVSEFFLLPYFRERTFSGKDGRLRTAIPIDTDNPQFESSDEEKHMDYAFRYSHSMGDWDIGLSYFHGTDREPYLINQIPASSFIPYYAQMDHLGIDLQGFVGDWVWKLEAVYKDSFEEYTAAVTGFEYTWVGAFGAVWDLGLLSEYLYDSRGEGINAVGQTNIYTYAVGQNDVFAGFRLGLNDEDSSEILFGMTQDLDNSDVQIYRLEASTRLTNHFSMSIEAWGMENRTQTDPLYSMREDDFVELGVEYYF